MKKKVLFPLVLISCLVLFSISPIIFSQGQNEGYVSVEGDTEMIGVGDISGGGHITWTFYGDKAKELRNNIIEMYDNSSFIPAYFVARRLGGGGTGANYDGNIDEGELGIYLESVDRWLETSFSSADRFRYYVIGRADTLYEEVSTSTDGLINTQWDSNEPVVVKFIFNSNTPQGRDEFQLAETKSMEAIFDIFSVNMTQDFEETVEPFSAGRWRRTTQNDYDDFGIYSFWYGNETTGHYEDNITSVTDAEIDLRFATSGNISFKYMGSVADNNDILDVSLSDDDGTNWHSILSLSQSNNTAEWTNFSFNFANNAFEDFTGKKVILRLNFTSDLSGNDTGFFIDHVRFDAPCRYSGQVKLGHVDYIVGVSSFSDPYVRRSSPHIIRLLGGEILLYSATFDTDDLPNDLVTYDSFNALENPAILFVVMFICVWFMVSFPNRFYSDYKLAHEPKKRHEADKILWLHWLGRILIIFMLLFYFFPTMFAVFGLNVFIGGAAMIIMSISFLLMMTFLSKFLYDKKIAQIPVPEKPPVVPGVVPVGAGDQPPVCLSCLGELNLAEATRCSCGVYYHPNCASKLDKCQACGNPIKEEELVPVPCPTCSEVTVLRKSANLIREKCSHCGAVMKSLEPGYNYLLIDKTPDTSYDILNSFIQKPTPALCLSTRHRDKLRKTHNLGESQTYWITTMSKDESTLDPKRLDFEIMRILNKFMKENNGGVVLIDGVEYLIAENGFDTTLAFLKKINDIASVNDITLLIPVNPILLEKEQLSALKRGFDKVEIVAEEFEEEKREEERKEEEVEEKEPKVAPSKAPTPPSKTPPKQAPSPPSETPPPPPPSDSPPEPPPETPKK